MDESGNLTLRTPGSSTAARNQDTILHNRLVDDDEGGSKADRSFLEDIARKQAEIIYGFPLASLTGVSDGESC